VSRGCPIYPSGCSAIKIVAKPEPESENNERLGKRNFENKATQNSPTDFRLKMVDKQAQLNQVT
jgi:hypothetical protein